MGDVRVKRRTCHRSPYNRDAEPVFASKTGNPFRPETLTDALRKALKATGVDKEPRPFHDGRHGALTAMAKTGADRGNDHGGHASMATTKRYLHLAGTVFPEEARAARAAARTFYRISTDLNASQGISDQFASLKRPKNGLADHARDM